MRSENNPYFQIWKNYADECHVGGLQRGLGIMGKPVTNENFSVVRMN